MTQCFRQEKINTLKHGRCILGIFFILIVMGCAAGISRQSRSKITYTGTFSMLQKTPDVYKGKVVMLGGRIIDTKTSPLLSELTVLQLALGSGSRPVNPDRSEGRYIVRTKQILDPEVYQKDMLLTVVGTLTGNRVLPIGDFKYTYPLVELIEIKLWPKEMQTQPHIYFGIGAGTSF